MTAEIEFYGGPKDGIRFDPGLGPRPDGTYVVDEVDTAIMHRYVRSDDLMIWSGFHVLVCPDGGRFQGAGHWCASCQMHRFNHKWVKI